MASATPVETGADGASSREGDQRLPSAALPIVIPFLAGAAVLLASLTNFLTYHGYGLLRPESAMVAGGLLAVAAVMAGLYLSVERLGRAALESILVYLAIDLNLDMMWLAIGTGVLTFTICYMRQHSILGFLTIIAGVVLLTTLAGIGEQRSHLKKSIGSVQRSSSEPAILHIILDEHMGIEGLTDTELRSDLEHFYVSRDFRLHRRAYSRHFHTINAIPDILNFGEGSRSEASRQHVRIGPTGYLSNLARRGYAINIYESDYADFCSDVAFASCTRYWGASLAFVQDLPMAPHEKALLIAHKFGVLSSGVTLIADTYDILLASTGLHRYGIPYIQLKQGSRSNAISALRAFDAVISDLRQARAGEAYFAHLLLPHFPYSLRSDCTVLPTSDWDFRRSPSPIPERRAAYYRQVRCASLKVDEALEALAASPAGRYSIVVLHGDHGSRIVRTGPVLKNVGSFTDADLVAGFSALFAVRAPALEPGVDLRTAAVPELLGTFARSGFRSTQIRRPGRLPHEVLLDDDSWVPRRPHPLPSAWQDGSQ